MIIALAVKFLVQYGGRGGYFLKNLKVSKVASSALAEGATFEHFFQKKVAFSAVAEEATFFIASSAAASILVKVTV